METFAETQNSDIEVEAPAFDYLAWLILPLTERIIESKLSAYTLNQPYDSLFYRYETPAMETAQDGEVQIRIIRDEDKVDPASGESLSAPIYTAIEVDFANPQTIEGEEANDRRRETYVRSELTDSEVWRLLEVIAHYKTAARQLSAEEAKSKGFSDAAIKLLLG